MACPATNAISVDNVLSSDRPEHNAPRAIVAAPHAARAVREVQERIEAEAVARGTFDAVVDLARYLPLVVVSDLVGLPEEGRENSLITAKHLPFALSAAKIHAGNSGDGRGL